ncbi:MAG: T9SS type A sorting domain-containing protein [Bacteroidota bacterium]
MKTIITRNIALIALFFFSFKTNAAIITAITNNGAWNSPDTWDRGSIPQCGDTIEIPVGLGITITQTVDLDDPTDPLCGKIQLNIAGTLKFSNGKKLNLGVGSCVNILAGGLIAPSKNGGGASERIMVGGVEEWRAGDGMLNGVAQLGCAVILPIELIDFSFQNIDDQVLIQWTTASERDNDYFYIEHSKDGYYWQEVGIIKGSGTSSSELNYQFIDKSPFFGKSYYRLSQYDINGISTVLGTQSNELVSTKYLLYPIPVNKSMFLEGNNLANSIVTVLNSVGEIIEVEQSFVGDKISFDFSEIKNGAYFVSIQNDNTKKTERIIVVHK